MENKIHSPLAQGLKKAREKNGLSQTQLAEKMNVHVRTIRNWEQDVAKPEVNNLYRLQELYGCDIAYLFGEIEGQTHDIDFIMKKTGLSEEAVEFLTNRRGALPNYFENFIETLNYLITEGKSLIEAITNYRGIFYSVDLYKSFIKGQYDFDEEIISEALNCSKGLLLMLDQDLAKAFFSGRLDDITNTKGKQLTDDELDALYRYCRAIHSLDIQMHKFNCSEQLTKLLSDIESRES